MRKHNLTRLAQSLAPEDVDDILAEEQPCRSTRMNATEDTDTKNTKRRIKRKQGRVQRAAERERKYRPPA